MNERSSIAMNEKSEVMTSRNNTLVVHRGARSLFAVPSQPGGQRWTYQVVFAVQLSPAEIGLAASIRWAHVRTVDLNAGNDMLIVDRIDPVEPRAIVPLNRNDPAVHPRRHEPLALNKSPTRVGFVPLGALTAEGEPHPHAGTGFGMSFFWGVPVDAKGVPSVHRYYNIEDPFRGIELQQYRYDGKTFAIEHTDRVASDGLLDGWSFEWAGFGNLLPDGLDLIGGLVGRRGDWQGSGLARWRRTEGRWRLCSFTPVAEAKNAFEPSLVRDGDGSLLLAARPMPQEPRPRSHSILAWRSADNGVTWESVLNLPLSRVPTPVTLNRGLNGMLYIASNPYREQDSKGGTSASHLRETLQLRPLSEDRRSLGDPVTVRDGDADFGAAPHGSVWWCDHPLGRTVRLADGRWRHLLTYRVLERDETIEGFPPTPHTGTYIEEVITPGPMAEPEWRF